MIPIKDKFKNFYLTHKKVQFDYQMEPLRVRVDMGSTAIKGYSVFLKASELLEPHYQTILCNMQDMCWEDLTTLQSVYSTTTADLATR